MKATKLWMSGDFLRSQTILFRIMCSNVIDPSFRFIASIALSVCSSVKIGASLKEHVMMLSFFNVWQLVT